MPVDEQPRYQIRYQYRKGARNGSWVDVPAGLSETQAREHAARFSLVNNAGRQVWLEVADNAHTTIAAYKDGKPNKPRAPRNAPAPVEVPEDQRWFPLISITTTAQLAETAAQRLPGTHEELTAAIGTTAANLRLHPAPKWKARNAGLAGQTCWYGRDANAIGYALTGAAGLP